MVGVGTLRVGPVGGLSAFGSLGFGSQPLAQAMLGDMHAEFDAAALLTARGAWMRDAGGGASRSEAAMAKLVATESASRIIDQAVQLHGARGIESGTVVESLYRDIRALRIYEGASEVQRLIIGRDAVESNAIASIGVADDVADGVAEPRT